MTPEQHMQKFLSSTLQGILDGTLTDKERAAVSILLFPSERFLLQVAEAANRETQCLMAGKELSSGGDVFDFQLRDPSETTTGRSLAAAPKSKHDAWLSSGVVADCGFVVRMSPRVNGRLDVVLFVKECLLKPAVLALTFPGSNSKSSFSKQVLPGHFAPAKLENMSDEQHLTVARALCEGPNPPFVCRLSFDLKGEALTSKRARLQLIDDIPNGTGNGSPTSSGSDPGVHRSAERPRQNLGIRDNGESAYGFLMNEAQREKAFENVVQQPRIASKLEDEWSADDARCAARRAIEAFRAGTFCPLVAKHGRSTEQYFLRMIKNATIDEQREIGNQPSNATNEGGVDDSVPTDQPPFRESATSWGQLGRDIEEYMRTFGIAGYFEFLDARERILSHIAKTKWHLELLMMILRESCTIEAAAAKLGKKPSSARAAFNRMIEKILRHHEAA